MKIGRETTQPDSDIDTVSWTGIGYLERIDGDQWCLLAIDEDGTERRFFLTALQDDGALSLGLDVRIDIREED